MSKTLRLLRSWPTFESPQKRIQEAAEAEQRGDKITLTGILQKANTLNQNGRIYPKNVLQREVQNYQKYVIERRATGELDHPDSSVISLQNVCHILTEVWMDGDVVYGTALILNTPSGKILQSLISDKVKLGISSRGVGSTERDGDYFFVQDDFQLICWDYVSEPSTPGAFMLPEHSAFMPEGKEIGGSPLIERIKDIRESGDDDLNCIVDEILSLR